MIIRLTTRMANLVTGWMEEGTLQKVTDFVGASLVANGQAEQIDESLVTVIQIGRRFIVTMIEAEKDSLELGNLQENSLRDVQLREEQSVESVKVPMQAAALNTTDFNNLAKFKGPRGLEKSETLKPKLE